MNILDSTRFAIKHLVAPHAQESPMSTASTVPTPEQIASAIAALPSTPAKESKLKEFEGFLKKAGHITDVVLGDLVRYAIPLASLAIAADPAAAPAASVFSAALKLVQTTVLAAQQKWNSEGSAANSQKLADVLTIVEDPVISMFASVGVKVDSAYVTNLVNGVVAILNAQPSTLPA